ncbi:AraC family transcriptional regulator [Labrenzia sp. R4_1]|uniref:AraC family transcriptional regulator n=1 Tax=Labrenzia sp. R4_1 TaxID=2821106 RepID=UPI001ADA9E26|nr:helix-turn-helix domain-containing protein [Labrenzia sp. R4_1]MBO9426722.1 AraC family transcriptional regulator [Labrenzia sp. R4_1]
MQADFLTFRTFDEIEAFWIEATGVSPTLTQLSAGPLNFKARSDEFAGVTLTWVKSEGRQLWRDTVQDGRLHFGYMIESEGLVRSAGIEINPADALVWIPGKVVDYLLEGPLFSLELTVSEEIIDALGWEPKGAPLRTVSEALLLHLTHVAQMASAWLDTAVDLDKQTFETRLNVWRDLLLDALAKVLQPWFQNSDMELTTLPASKQYDIIRSAEVLFSNGEIENSPDASVIAADLGISRRKLYYAFQNTLGIGPRRFIELKRLHQLRRDLRSAHRDETSVTELAYKNGFSQLGRLSGLYKQHFGEGPRETLLRPA